MGHGPRPAQLLRDRRPSGISRSWRSGTMAPGLMAGGLAMGGATRRLRWASRRGLTAGRPGIRACTSNRPPRAPEQGGHMPKSVQEQTVVVVGASSGIGRATARMLAEQGARVLAAARSADDLATLEQETATAAGTLRTVVADVDSQESMESVAAAAVQEFGGIDTWVGCAASSVYGRAWEIPPTEYEQVMRTNWLGQVHGALAALPELRRNGGTLVLIGSVESVRAVPLHAPYV